VNYLFDITKKIAISLIKLYQKTLSFDHSWLKIYYPHGFCRFHPSCSQYSIEAIDKYGLVRGGLKAAWRILRCNPFNKGGYDPLK
jgi:hypothetical protein